MKPRITMAVLAYKQAWCIEAAVRSALEQDCEPIEILLSDDHSTDDTFARMQVLAHAYGGPHLVAVRRNDRNLGIGGHYNAVMAAASGELVVLMAGDDISHPQRVARITQEWDAHGTRPDLIASHVVDMDETGHDHGLITVDDLAQWTSLDSWARRRPYIVGAGHAVTRRLFLRFGPLQDDVVYEDQVNTLRAILCGGALTIAEPLLRYRRGGVSQAAVRMSGQEFVLRAQRDNQRHLSLHQQWRLDAALLGQADTVQRATERDYRRGRFLADLFQAPCGAARLWVALSAHGVALGWRLRKALYWQWPSLGASVRRWQAKLKALRKRRVAPIQG